MDEDKKDVIQQPDDLIQQKLNELYEAKPEMVNFMGRKVSVGWMHHGTMRKFSDIMMTENDPHKTDCKLAAVVLLNGLWKIRFFYWAVWRWLHYISDADDIEILRLVVAAKKKVQQDAFFLITMFSTEMTDMMMTMTKEEVKRIRAAHLGGRPTP